MVKKCSCLQKNNFRCNFTTCSPVKKTMKGIGSKNMVHDSWCMMPDSF